MDNVTVDEIRSELEAAIGYFEGLVGEYSLEEFQCEAQELEFSDVVNGVVHWAICEAFRPGGNVCVDSRGVADLIALQRDRLSRV